MGVLFPIDTTAHTPSGFTLLRSGFDEARRGWREKEDLLNTPDLAGPLESIGNRSEGGEQVAVPLDRQKLQQF